MLRIAALTLISLAAAPAAAQAALTVDARSVGGRCDDRRAATAVSAATPWCSLAKAATAAPDGSTVEVRAGVYPRLTASRRAGQPITFTAAAGERPSVAGLTLTGATNLHFRGFLVTGGSSLTNVADLRFEGNEVALKPAGSATPAGFVVTGARRVAWERNHLHDGLTGILTRWGGLEDITIRGNRFERFGEDGVFVRLGKRVTIEDNHFTDIHARSNIRPGAHPDAVQVVGASEDVKLNRNVIRGGRGYIIQFGPAESTLKGVAHVRTEVSGNLFLGPDFAVRAWSAPGIRITDNTAWGTGLSASAGVDLYKGVGANAKTTGVVMTDNVIRRLQVESGVTFAEERRNAVEQAFPTTFRLDASSLLGPVAFASPSTGDYTVAGTSRVAGSGVTAAL